MDLASYHRRQKETVQDTSRRGEHGTRRSPRSWISLPEETVRLGGCEPHAGKVLGRQSWWADPAAARGAQQASGITAVAGGLGGPGKGGLATES